MSDINSATLGGRLGADPETKHTNSGKQITTYRLATTTGWGDRKGTVWTRVEMWGDRGARPAQFLRKGSPVTFSGKLKIDEWEDKNGNKRQTLILEASECFLPPKSENQGQRSSGGYGNSGGGSGYGGGSGRNTGQTHDDDSIPF